MQRVFRVDTHFHTRYGTAATVLGKGADTADGKAILGAAVGDHRMVRVSDDYSYEVVIQSIENAEDDGSAPLLPY